MRVDDVLAALGMRTPAARRPYRRVRARGLQVLAGLAIAAAMVHAQPIAPVSGGNVVKVTGSGGSFMPVFSEDGNFLAFLSHANNLVTNDDRGLTLDVFLSDVLGQSIELISANTNGTGGGNADCGQVSVSRYGTMVTFASRSSNLTTNDTNNAVDVFVRRSVGGTRRTTLISADPFGRPAVEPVPYLPRPLSSHPTIGRDVFPPVVLQSFATNLVLIKDTNGASDIFVTASTFPGLFPLSVARSGGATADGASHSPQLAGRFVGFISTATNMHALPPPGVATNTNPGGDIYVRSLDSTNIYWASPNTRRLLLGAFPAPPSTYTCFNFAVSGGNGAVAYQASAGGPYSSNVLLYCTLGAANATRIATDSDLVGRPQISYDGTLVAFSSRSNIYIWNSLTGSNTLVSVNTNGLPANGPSHSPLLHPFGSYIVFLSRATDLVTNSVSNSFQIYLRLLPDGPTRLVSVNTNGTASAGNFELSSIAIAPEGGWRVAFDSMAPDLVQDDLNAASDVFVRDVAANQTRLISRALPSRPARTETPMSGAPVSLSADGRIVAFASFDNPRVPDDTNRWQDVFGRDLMTEDLRRVSGGPEPSPSYWYAQAAVEPVVSGLGHHVVYAVQRGPFSNEKNVFWHDLLTGSNRLVTATTSGELPQSGVSGGASITHDGNLVIFESTVPGSTFQFGIADGNSAADIFARDMTSGQVTLVSVEHTGNGSANRASTNAVLSPDGRWVAFESTATDLLPSNVTGGLRSLFARDLRSNRTELVSIGPTGGSQFGSRERGAFSGNSRFVAFVGGNYPIVRRDLETKTSAFVCANCERPSLNFDGRFIAYQTTPAVAPARQVYVTDMASGLAKLLSANLSGNPGNGHSTEPIITPDGRFVIFTSFASDLVQNDRNNAADIFVGDRVHGHLLLLTISRDGSGSANGGSSRPALSANGRTVVFQSVATDLVSGDFNDRRDVFVATLSMPDSDGDGMDDDFEITYFGDLSRDGTADSDSDSQTDAQEFLAGTNPTSDLSVLRVVTLTAGGAGRQIIWSAVAGRSYAVQFKDLLTDGWTTLAGVVRATASTATKLDTSAGPQRFYRVVLAE